MTVKHPPACMPLILTLMFCSPRPPGRPPSQPPHVALHSLLPAPPKPTSGAAYRARRHLGLQLEGIKGSGGGRGVFLVLGMFWVSSYSSGPVLWMCGARGDCHAHWWDLQSCYQNLDFKWATVCGGAVVCISPLSVVCLSKRSSQPGRWTQQPFFKSI